MLTRGWLVSILTSAKHLNIVFFKISQGDVRRYEVSGANFNVSGWGRLAVGQASPDILHVVSVPFVSDTDCQRLYGHRPITPRMMCAGDLVNGGEKK